MIRSLRFRVPALFLAAVVLAGVMATVIAIGLFQSYARERALNELRREAKGVAELFRREAGVSESRVVVPATLQQAIGDRLFYAGLSPFPDPGQKTGLQELPRGTLERDDVFSGRVVTFEFTPPGEDHPLLAVAHPVTLRGHTLGAVIAAKPVTELRNRWLTLTSRLALAFAGGLLAAGALAWYLSRRITRPVLELSAAADEIARRSYDVDLLDTSSGDEIAHLAERFREMAARLAEAEALERNFLMTVSHELRTPLTAIRGHVEALREGVAADEAARAASLDVIAAETARLERLVNDVLDLARLETHRFTVRREEVDTERVLDRAYARFGEEARHRGIDYRKDVSARPVIVSDGDRVLQIVSNLIANAFHWTPDGGRVDVSLSAENGAVSVTVADSGPGIDREEQELIFRPFWSGDGRGTGLGLPIARELAVALGGRIVVASTPGEGSRFRLDLPAER